MLSQVEGGEEQWVPDPQDLEERDILRVTYTGKSLEWTFQAQPSSLLECDHSMSL